MIYLLKEDNKILVPLEYASSYAELGWAVIPLSPYYSNNESAGKRPLIKEWQKRGVPTEEEIIVWRQKYPAANVGVVLGSNSGLVGIDVDGQTGEELLLEWSQGDLPVTWEYITPGGGRRLIYKIHNSIKLQKRSQADRTKEHEELALLGEGSQTVIPPSIHKNGGIYKWIKGKTPKNIECAVAPKWLIDKMTAPKANKKEKKPSAKRLKEKSSEIIINRLIEKCQQFSRDWVVQQVQGLDEPAWFNWLCLFVAAGMPDMAKRFSKEAEKHDCHSERRIDDLIFTQDGKNIPPVRCTTFGCKQEQIEKCFGCINDNKDGEITNSPASLLIQDLVHDGAEEKYFEKGAFIPKWLGDDILRGNHFVSTEEDFYIYENGTYVPGGYNAAQKECIEKLGEGFRKDRVEGTIYYINAKSRHKIDELNNESDVINLKNGLYKFDTEEFTNHDPNLLLTVQLNASYDKDADCLNFIQFLNQILPPENIILLQEIFGYCLIPETKGQKSFILYGMGQTGKSTVLSVLENMLGIENVSNIRWQNLSDRFETANLYGKLANIASELPLKTIQDSSIFKAATGEDYLTGERKFKNSFKFKSFARLLFSCNQLPQSKDATSAFYRRLIIIPFMYVCPNDEKDVNLKSKLLAETDGIFQWSLEGLQRLTKNNFVFSENKTTNEMLEEYKFQNSSVLRFMYDCCTVKQGEYVQRSLLFTKYQDYCFENSFTVVNQIDFNKQIVENFPDVKKAKHGHNSIRVWKGLKYGKEADNTEVKTLVALNQ